MRHEICLLCSWFSSVSYTRAITGEWIIPLAVSSEWLCKMVLKAPLTSFWQSPKGLRAACSCSVLGCPQTWVWVVWQKRLTLQFALKQQCLNDVSWADRPPQGSAELCVDLCSSEFITNKVMVTANSLYDLISTFNVILFAKNGYRCPHYGTLLSGKSTLWLWICRQ